MFRLLVLALALSSPLRTQSSLSFLRERFKLLDDDITSLHRGEPIVRELKTPDANEILIYGAIQIKAPAEKFVQSFSRPESQINGTSYLAASRFHEPPNAADLNALTMDEETFRELAKCEPGDCDFQLSADMMRQFRAQVRWSSPQALPRATDLVRRFALGAVEAYRAGGNAALGEYHDKKHPTRVSVTFSNVIHRAADFPTHFPAFYRYLLDYPAARPPRTTDFFYWEIVRFGLKPTFRINHAIIHEPPGRDGNWLIATKQLYASHYFQTAIDLWLCLRDSPDSPSYYLLTLKGSRQDGLSGAKGRLIRGTVLSRTKDAMEKAMLRLKQANEQH